MAEIIKPAAIVVPPVGETFSDPAFGTVIKRITQAPPGLWISTEYPTIDAFNCDCSLFLLLAVDHFQLYCDTGFIRDLPISASSEPRWDRTNPHLLYYHDAPGNQLKSMDVSTCSVQALRNFDCGQITFGSGEGDLSDDGTKLCIVTDNCIVFMYDIAMDLMRPVITGQPLDSAYVTPDNNILMSWEAKGTARFQGMELFDGKGNFLRQLRAANGHKCCARSTDGRELLIWCNSDDPAPLDGCPNGIVSIDLATGEQKCLLSLPWSEAVHISRNGLVETYARPGLDWEPYMGELLIVRDGFQVQRLCHHRSSAADYTSQPKATISRNGARILFSSDMGGQVDVYSIELPQMPDIASRLRRGGVD